MAPQVLRHNLALAEALAGRGWHVFPCKVDKSPATGHGFKDATTDPAIIAAWEWPLIGVYCEGSGFFALDIDRRTETGIDGVESWIKLIADNANGEPVKYGPEQMTPSGGRHALFTLPPTIKVPNNAGKLAPGLDLRSNGYICTGCPETGYRWMDNDPGKPLTPAPAWLLELIRQMADKPARETPAPPIVSTATDPGKYWLDRYLPLAAPGNRNSTGFDLAAQLRDSGLSEGEAEGVMLAYAERVPQGSDPYTAAEALASLKSAYSGTPREPAKLRSLAAPIRADKDNPQPRIDRVPTGQQTPTLQNMSNQQVNQSTQAAPARPKQPPKPTDDELAAWWVSQTDKTAFGLGEWRRYKGGIWVVVPEDTIAAEIRTILRQAKKEGIRPTRSALNSVMEFARLEILISDDRWDSNPNILTCNNGVLDLTTFELSEHSPDHYVTSKLNYDYDPAAAAPTWDHVLQTTIPESSSFLQEFFGYCLTTSTRYETAVWFVGAAGSGKSTIIEGGQAMLGERCGQLGLAEVERSRFALAAMQGRTLVVAAEQPAMYMQASHVLNAIISGEKITIERKYKNPFSFRPCAKVLWAMNEMPRVPNGCNGLFRRVKVVQFPPLLKTKRDPKIKEAVKLEGAGILNWAIAGLRRLEERGYFDVPDSVAAATVAFQETNDIPALFVGDRCEVESGRRVQSQALYIAYKNWCEETGHKPQSSTTIAGDWARLGFERYVSAGRFFWRGIGLKPYDI